MFLTLFWFVNAFILFFQVSIIFSIDNRRFQEMFYCYCYFFLIFRDSIHFIMYNLLIFEVWLLLYIYSWKLISNNTITMGSYRSFHFNMLMFLRKWFKPQLVWLHGLRAGLWSKRSLVWFPVRAHAWIVDQVPSWGHVRGNHTLMFFSLPSLLLKNK